MRRSLWTIVGLTLLGAAWLLQDVVHGADRTRIFATFVSHNEESASNPPCAPVLTDPIRFLANRAAVVSLAAMIRDRGAAWDFQTEWEYLSRLSNWEDAAARESTGGLNLVQYLNNMAPGRIQVDAHSHERQGYNYADVAYLLDRFQVPPSGIVGGFIASPVSRQTWTRLRSPLTGSKYRSYAWTAHTLWGGGSAGHTDDSNASGIWRPRSAEAFEEDDPSQTLLAIGNYPGADSPVDPGPVEHLLELLRTGKLEPGRMYTATIMIKQCDLDSDPTLAVRVASFIDQFAGDVDRGDLVWAPMTEMVRVWRSDYGSVPLVAHP